jgi:hypothetical protein
MPGEFTRRLRAVVALAVLSASMTACVPGSGSAGPTPTGSTVSTASPAKAGTGEVRHDLTPLTDRIPSLTGAPSATWMSGTLGDERAPGPSLYWIDAVVELPAGSADALRTSLELHPAAERPDVVGGLAEAMPDGVLLTGTALDDAFASGGWSTTAYLEDGGDRVVMLIVGE